MNAPATTEATAELPVVVIGAGPTGLAAAAHLTGRGITPLVLEAGQAAGAAVRDWAHVRLFSPWGEVVDPAPEKLLAPTGWTRPDPAAYPSGGDWAEQYLQPLADALGDKVRFGATVTGVSRSGRDRIVDADREAQPFVVHIACADGREERIVARAVIDASGTWTSPSPAGGSGLPALGEKAAADRITYRVPDLKDPAVRTRYAGRRTAVIGSGASAFTALASLADLAKADGGAGTKAVWILRRGISGATFGGGEADQLPARGALGLAAKAAVDNGYAAAVTGFRTEAVERDSDGRVVLVGEDGRRLDAVDEVTVLTGLSASPCAICSNASDSAPTRPSGPPPSPPTPTGRPSRPPAASRPRPATSAWPPSTAPQPSSATSGRPPPPTTQHRTGAATMPDDLFGDRVPRAARKKAARRRASELDLRTISQRIMDVARFEDLYRLASVLAPAPGPRRGRPSHYPPYIYLLFLALRGIHGSARYCAGDLQNPNVWRTIRGSVAHHLGEDEAARLPETGPSRRQWQHAQRTLLIPRLEELGEAFADLALAQALRQGLLPADERHSWSRAQRHQLIAGDGTVTRSPALSTTPYSVDPTTGEIRRHRVDPTSSWQKEGGADRTGNNTQTTTPGRTATDTDADADADANKNEEAMVLGSKFVVFSTRHRGYFRRVFLHYAHVPHNQPGGEAAVALDLACAILDAADGCMGVLYDGALRGMHRDVIARRGRLLINKQHKGTLPRYIRTLAFDDCRHELWSSSGRVHELAPSTTAPAPSSPCPSTNSNAAPVPIPTAGTTCSTSPAPAAPTNTANPSASPAPPQNTTEAKATPKPASTAPSTCSRSPTTPLSTRPSTAAAKTPKPASPNSTAPYGTAA
ncbi:flavoprotein [Streptomyces sp. PRh5]|nr:flavoprotein [Streptomyces sp. PRh5]